MWGSKRGRKQPGRRLEWRVEALHPPLLLLPPQSDWCTALLPTSMWTSQPCPQSPILPDRQPTLSSSNLSSPSSPPATPLLLIYLYLPLSNMFTIYHLNLPEIPPSNHSRQPDLDFRTTSSPEETTIHTSKTTSLLRAPRTEGSSSAVPPTTSHIFSSRPLQLS